jgi:hypothetical protein
VVGLVNIEGALAGKIVITTPQAGIPEISSFGGVICENDVSALNSMLYEIYQLSDEEYLLRAKNLQRWALDNFNKSKILIEWQLLIRYAMNNKLDNFSL